MEQRAQGRGHGAWSMEHRAQGRGRRGKPLSGDIMAKALRLPFSGLCLLRLY